MTDIAEVHEVARVSIAPVHDQVAGGDHGASVRRPATHESRTHHASTTRAPREHQASTRRAPRCLTSASPRPPTGTVQFLAGRSSVSSSRKAIVPDTARRAMAVRRTTMATPTLGWSGRAAAVSCLTGLARHLTPRQAFPSCHGLHRGISNQVLTDATPSSAALHGAMVHCCLSPPCSPARMTLGGRRVTQRLFFHSHHGPSGGCGGGPCRLTRRPDDDRIHPRLRSRPSRAADGRGADFRAQRQHGAASRHHVQPCRLLQHPRTAPRTVRTHRSPTRVIATDARGQRLDR